jgi:D-glycero-alpha-D-manno-heptose-7-phosphate kinase
MRIHAQSPCRVDLAGGTLDIWPLYLYHSSSCTVNFAVNLYTRCTIEPRPGRGIVLRSRDQKQEERFASLDQLMSVRAYRLPLLAWQVRVFQPRGGFLLDTESEAPAGAGISGSSSLMITLANALNRYTASGYSKEQLRGICQNVESQVIRVPTGAQDFFPALYGGVNVIEMGPSGVARRQLNIDRNKFHSRFVLAYTGVPRNSGINNWEVIKAHINGDRMVHRNFDRIAKIAREMSVAVEREDWDEAGLLLRAEWEHRRLNAPGISTPLMDELVAKTRRKGAIGAKICGAGGGGCAIFLVKDGAREAVAGVIAEHGARILDVAVAAGGARVHSKG